ncbi:MAG: hypothetical protein ABIO70_25340 [Pseudomonadota bacterium]
MAHRVLYILALLTLLLAALPAAAQEGDVIAQLEQGAQLSPEEMLQYTDTGIAEMNSGVEAVAKMLEAAERDREIVKVQCLSNKLTQLRAFANVGGSIQQHVKDSLAENDPEQSSFHLRQFVVLMARFRELRAQADACVGPGSGKGNANTTVDVTEAGMSVSDETNGPEFSEDFGNNPPPTSQFE